MITCKIWWPEDKERIVAQDAYAGIVDVYGNELDISEEYDIITIKGDEEIIDQVIAELEQTYNKYGRIAVKKEIIESKINEAKQIDSFGETIQKEFDKLASHFATFKCQSFKHKQKNFDEKLEEFEMRFLAFKKMAVGSDKDKVQKYIDDVVSLKNAHEDVEDMPKMKGRQFRKSFEKKKNYQDRHIEHDYVNKNNGGTYWDRDVQVYEAPEDLEEAYKKYVRNRLADPKNWGIIEESVNEDWEWPIEVNLFNVINLENYDNKHCDSGITVSTSNKVNSKFMEEFKSLDKDVKDDVKTIVKDINDWDLTEFGITLRIRTNDEQGYYSVDCSEYNSIENKKNIEISLKDQGISVSDEAIDFVSEWIDLGIDSIDGDEGTFE